MSESTAPARSASARRRPWLSAGAAVLLASCLSLRSREASTPPGGVVRATLDNGLQVVLVRSALAPVVTQQVTYFAGSNQSPAGFPGTAHAVEHMMFRGSPGLSGDQLSQISAQLGGDENAYTTDTTTTFFLTVPSEDLNTILRIEAIRMRGVDMRSEDWDTERGAIEQEVARDNSNPFYVLEAKARERIFAGAPYADTGLGTKPSFDATTVETLKSFHDTWYGPDNALLVIAGDIDPQSVLADVKSLFGSIPRKGVPSQPRPVFRAVQPEVFRSTTDQASGTVAFVFRTPGYRSPDLPAVQILSQVLDSPRGAISALTYDGKALGSGFFQQTFPDTGLAIAYAELPRGADADALQRELRSAVEKAGSDIPRDLVDAERRRVVLDARLRNGSISDLARSWTDAVALEGLDSPDREVAMLERVDAGAVKRAARDYLDFGHAMTLVLTPGAASENAGGGQVFGTAESFASTPEKPVELPDWAAAALARLPHPRPPFQPAVSELPNGVRLIVQPLPGSGAVSLSGSVHTDEKRQAPAGKDGVSDLMNTLLDWGPRNKSRSQFEAEMDGIGAEYSTGTRFSLQVLPGYFDKGVQLMAEDLLDPSFPEDAFASQKRAEAQQAQGRVSSPRYRFGQAVRQSLAPEGDPSARSPTPQTIDSLTLEDVRAYHRSVVRPDETTIVVMGDIEPGAAREVVSRYFGSWKAEGPKPVLDYPPVPPSRPGFVFVPDPVTEQDEVVLAETVALDYNDPDHYALQLGNEFLGGASFASPLYRELRVKRGLVYSVGSSTSFTRTRGLFSLSFGAYPDRVDEAGQLAVQVVQSMANASLSDQDLHLAKAQALRQIELTSQTASAIADQWLGYSEEGLPLDRLYEVAARYEALTAADIQQAFGKYLDTSRLSRFVLGRPLPK